MLGEATWVDILRDVLYIFFFTKGVLNILKLSLNKQHPYIDYVMPDQRWLFNMYV